jgi:hypothetical protein
VKRTKREGRRGSAMLECALSLTAVVVIFIGIVDIGQLLFVQQTLVERVRRGTSYGVRVYDPEAIRTVVLYGTSTPSAGQNPFWNLTPSMVSVQRYDAGTPADRITVAISGYPLRFCTPGVSRVAAAIPMSMTAAYDGGS